MEAASLAMKAGRRVTGATRGKIRPGCNSFTAETPVLLPGGLTAPIAALQFGDWVTTTDPIIRQISNQPVLDAIVGHGTKHLLTITTTDHAGQDASPFFATAGHPVWVEGTGRVDVDHLTVGDRMRGATGGTRLVAATHDHGWLFGQTVYNLAVANTHTYHVGEAADLAHNCARTRIIKGGVSTRGQRAVAWAKNTAKNKGLGSLPKVSYRRSTSSSSAPR